MLRWKKFIREKIKLARKKLCFAVFACIIFAENFATNKNPLTQYCYFC